jgi:AAA15 family ATPase/GTPase
MEHMWRNDVMDVSKATKILKAFDPSIVSIELMREDNPNAYQIKFENGDLLVVDMSNDKSVLNDPRRLSKGTFEGLGIVRFIEDMSQGKTSSTYFLDERMAHVHSELEKAMLNLMIQKLGNESQFFYTTHNNDLLELDIPIHSHLFLKRKDNGLIEAIQPELSFKKNDRKLVNYVKNDIFGTCPDTSLIDGIAYGE